MNNTDSPKKLILIVDDTPDPCQILPMILAEAGFKVWWACSGKQVLKLIEKKPDLKLADLILLDIIMPEMDGFEVCQHLKSNEKNSVYSHYFYDNSLRL